MIENKKVYNIKIYNDELDIIISILLERIKQLKEEIMDEEDEIQKDFIKFNIQKYKNIITRLETGAIYNDSEV